MVLSRRRCWEAQLLSVATLKRCHANNSLLAAEWEQAGVLYAKCGALSFISIAGSVTVAPALTLEGVAGYTASITTTFAALLFFPC